MTTFISILTLAALVAGLMALVSYARHDRFGGPNIRTYPHDELGTLSFRRRPA
jgi:hypothetical protein